ncbi:MAG TPA: D-amino acid dehydrogenase [Burkholderiaceae bacterium]|nr:D-amino acid dehydrogenase [Burkholderiaceae bacterium]
MHTTHTSPRHAVVIGAGIIGLSTAWCLQRDGWRVTVIDRDAPGQGASGGNGAQLSYSYVAPLAEPSIWRQLPKLLLKADSPLKFRLQADARQWAWGLRFLAACRADVAEATTAQLLALAAESRAAFEQLLRTESLDCDHSTTGKLVLYPDSDSFAAAQRQLDLQRRLGCQPQFALTPQQCTDIEPTLADFAHRVAGGIHTPSEGAADCLKVCEGLHSRLAERGVRFVLGSRVKGWAREGNRIAAIDTDVGQLVADAFVLAAGTDSARLGSLLGLDVPVYPLKGYSITLPLESPAAASAAPKLSVTDLGRKVVFARLGDRLRVAGMAELVGENLSIPPSRIDSLRATTADVFPHLPIMGDTAGWAGLRPATPTGRPLVGSVPGAPANLMLNTGHGALGFTLAMGSAERVTNALRESISLA